ncbi:MAG: RagB/SusD family nutrient uptake outer membrane protein [Bacteroidales bacterium]|nr:RagB/SusD family nutrient uptake outer membrane protein [Bacteroidales bacterium]
MKKTILILLSAALAASCANMLDLYPHSAVAPEAITGDDVPQLRVGMYWEVQELPGRTSYIIEDMLGGNLTQKNSTSTMALINSILNAQSEIVEDAWQGAYRALYQVNNVYSVAERLPEGDLRNQVLGEACYFRAYIYIQLVTRWGDVPLLTRNTVDDVPRTPAADVWDQIIKDLDKAIGLLGDSGDVYYVSQDAAKALKARALLYMGRKDEAAAIADELIALPRYALDDFDVIFRGGGDKETIFAFKCATLDGSVIGLSNLFYSYNHPNKGNYSYMPAPDVMTLFDDGDKRKDITVTTLDGLNFINKYPSGQTGTDPFIVSRLAEMYLISAEAKGVDGGLGRLNELRVKRGLPEVYPMTERAFQDAVMLERRKEFVAENMRFTDLVRTGRAVDELGIQPYQQLLPIPESEMQNNSLLKPQNPNY